ncbi:penicillin-binding protein 2 [Oceanidesulfovibrio marinus]|uniref:Penicillin-binding protein 2 n=1 Tax=Oceanidesulfovibrio marinus TaxID=370038 RepID=A0A6M4XAS8_9BACT|nr:penicillin-binding protein 2 [Oceanidesulfovibrio marinus]QJT09944.1 penicillin-binding protein 2 [Oceanidesulfovibrio marinus]TVM35939.1 penicillin-binding protein 2 [Oceanidesulfovibrio marinus]
MPIRSDSHDSQPAPKLGLILLQFLTLVLFFCFGLRFWYLQVHKGADFEEKARQNQLREEEVYAPRGRILDRSGNLLAINQPAYALAIVREDVEDEEATLRQVSEWTSIPYEELEERMAKGRRKTKPFDRLILVPDMDFELVSLIESNKIYWPGLEIVIRPRRVYLQGPLLAHILGYVAEANEKELGERPELSMGDMVGKQGLEYMIEDRLRGEKGLKRVEVDATGRRLKEFMVEQPRAGESIALSIDLGLQEKASKLLEGQAGGIVVLDPDTGKVLALVTQPTYDNNAFAAGLTRTQWNALRSHPRNPLQNRVIQSVYPPGSVWKLLVAGCALHENMVDPNETFFCGGSYRLGRRVFRCWRSWGHGNENLMEALVDSCDVYFYQLGERLGVDRISKFAFACGFGKPTGIDLPHEKGGLVPTRAWKRKRFNEPWHGGETLNLAIGQGFTLVQPLQVARFVAALLNGGKLYKPSLLRDEAPLVQGDVPMDEAQRQLILEAMVKTVEEGTARRIKRPDAVLGGKTGTAQVIRIGTERLDKEDMPYMHRDHAWLASWGQKGDKRYVVICMIEHGGHGGSAAGPLVREIYNYLFGEPDAEAAKPGN